MRTSRIAAAIGAAGFTLLGAATSSHAAIAYALTDSNSLISFDTSTPGTLLSGIKLHTAALANIEDLIGIDFRPANNTIYGVGHFGTIYTLNPTTGVATPGAVMNVTLSGSRFGFDFNPVADRLRITSDTKQNLRVDVTTGLTTNDTALNPGNPNVTASAYTNNFAGATTTTLYGIDSVTDQLVVQAPPNNGTLTNVGPLGIDVSSLNGFDITTTGSLAGGPNSVQTGYAAMQLATNGVSNFYGINLTTGAATLVGTIGGGDFIDGLTIAVPEPTTLGLLGGVAVMMVRRRAR